MIRVGLVDGSLPAGTSGLLASRNFCPDDGCPLATTHASAMAATIALHAQDACFMSAAVFPGRLVTNLQTVCDALDWLAGDPPDLVLCSFGVTHSSLDLALAAARLQQVGCLIIASAPARGVPVYPSAFEGVISVQGDARCGPGEVSRLDLPQATYGACPVANEYPHIRGASAAAAHLAGLLAGSDLILQAPVDRILERSIRYVGRERKAHEACKL